MTFVDWVFLVKKTFLDLNFFGDEFFEDAADEFVFGGCEDLFGDFVEINGLIGDHHEVEFSIDSQKFDVQND